MAKYKVIFTIKDKYGHSKELTGGEIEVDLGEITLKDTQRIAEALNLDDYATDVELATAVKDVPTVETVKELFKTDLPNALEENAEAHQVVASIVESHVDTIKYGTFSDPIE